LIGKNHSLGVTWSPQLASSTEDAADRRHFMTSEALNGRNPLCTVTLFSLPA